MKKETFINLIKSLRDQRDFDFNYVNKLTDLYKADIDPYDTSILTGAIFDLFEYSFPGKLSCIKIFCYELDYGRFIKTEGCPIEELWLELKPYLKVPSLDTWYEQNLEETKKIFESKIPIQPLMGGIVSTHPLINDMEVTYQVVSPLKDKPTKYSIENEI